MKVQLTFTLPTERCGGSAGASGPTGAASARMLRALFLARARLVRDRPMLAYLAAQTANVSQKLYVGGRGEQTARCGMTRHCVRSSPRRRNHLTQSRALLHGTRDGLTIDSAKTEFNACCVHTYAYMNMTVTPCAASGTS